MPLYQLKWLLALGFILAAMAANAFPPQNLQLAPVVTGLNRPVAVRHAGDGSGRLFVVEQAGRILILDLSDTLIGGTVSGYHNES